MFEAYLFLIVMLVFGGVVTVGAIDKSLFCKPWTKAKEIYFMWVTSTVFNREKLRVGEGSVWSQGCLFNCDGGLTIGRNVLIGPHVCIHTTNHIYQDRAIPIKFQGNSPEPVIIEDDVWIGANCVVLPGVRLGRGCIVGAGSIVTKNIAPYCVAVGNPAHVIKRRGEVGCLTDVTEYLTVTT